MDIVDFKKHFFEKRKKINDIIDTDLYNDDGFSEDIFINLFNRINPEDLNNDHVAGLILVCFQLINDENFYSKYTLEDIEEIYKYLVTGKEYSSIDIVVDYAHFLYAIMDKNEEAKKIAIEGLARTKKITKDLKSLLKQIEEDSI